MNDTKDGLKYRQLHIEDYLQMVSAEQKEYAEVYAHQRISENNVINTEFKTTGLLESIDEEKAWICANMRNGHWYCDGYCIVNFALSNEKLREWGYMTFTEQYLNVRVN
jgi:hypothetical protein